MSSRQNCRNQGAVEFTKKYNDSVQTHYRMKIEYKSCFLAPIVDVLDTVADAKCCPIGVGSGRVATGKNEIEAAEANIVPI